MFKFTHEQLNKMVLEAMEKPEDTSRIEMGIQKVMETVEKMKGLPQRIMGSKQP